MYETIIYTNSTQKILLFDILPLMYREVTCSVPSAVTVVDTGVPWEHFLFTVSPIFPTLPVSPSLLFPLNLSNSKAGFILRMSGRGAAAEGV